MTGPQAPRPSRPTLLPGLDSLGQGRPIPPGTETPLWLGLELVLIPGENQATGSREEGAPQAAGTERHRARKGGGGREAGPAREDAGGGLVPARLRALPAGPSAAAGGGPGAAGLALVLGPERPPQRQLSPRPPPEEGGCREAGRVRRAARVPGPGRPPHGRLPAARQTARRLPGPRRGGGARGASQAPLLPGRGPGVLWAERGTRGRRAPREGEESVGPRPGPLRPPGCGAACATRARDAAVSGLTRGCGRSEGAAASEPWLWPSGGRAWGRQLGGRGGAPDSGQDPGGARGEKRGLLEG